MTTVSDNNDLRTEIWDLIYRSGALEIAAIAEILKRPVEEIQDATDDEWFQIVDNKVTIAT